MGGEASIVHDVRWPIISLAAELTKQVAEGAKLDEAIRAKLVTLGFPIENEP